MKLNDYLKRVPAQHRDKLRFQATLRTILEPVLQLQALLEETPEAYDLDTAIGKQLDVVGEWVGVGRYVDHPIDGIYFEWNSKTRTTGWGAGQWKGKYDPSTGLVALDDYTYRTLIKLQIAANRWDGSADQAYEAWRSTFESSNIIIEDHLDMSITIGIAGRFQSTSQQALFTKQISPFKPGGVRISVYFIATDANAPIFAWGLKTDNLEGWGRAYWAEKYVMP